MTDPAPAPDQPRPARALSEAEVVDLVERSLAREDTRAWLFRESLPPGHALLAGAAEARPALVRCDRRPEDHALDLYLEHPAQGWRLLINLSVRVTERLTREYHDACRARGAKAKDEKLVSGSLVVVLAPRRYARDSGNAQRFSRCITLENYADHLAEHADSLPESEAWALRATRRDLRESCEHQVRVSTQAQADKARKAWADYDAILASYSMHLRVEARGATLAGNVRFALGAGRRVEHLPPVALIHNLKDNRASLDYTLPPDQAAPTAARLREDLPRDIYIDQTPQGLSLWLRLPPLELRGGLAAQPNDLRHAFLSLWRLKDWHRRHADEWARWRGLASEA